MYFVGPETYQCTVAFRISKCYGYKTKRSYFQQLHMICIIIRFFFSKPRRTVQILLVQVRVSNIVYSRTRLRCESRSQGKICAVIHGLVVTGIFLFISREQPRITAHLPLRFSKGHQNDDAQLSQAPHIRCDLCFPLLYPLQQKVSP